MTMETEEIDISQEKVEDMAEDTDIDEKYLRKAMENEKADQRYQRCQEQYNNNEYDNERDIGDIKKAVKFLATTIYSVPTTPNFATIIDIKAPNNPNQIIVKTETEYPSIDKMDIDKDTFTNKHKFDLSDSEDRFIFENVLDSVDAYDPSELEDEEVPIVPDQDSTGYRRTPNFDYKLDVVEPNMTLYEKTHRKLVRILMGLNCIERSTEYWGGKESGGEFVINKNFILYMILMLNIINYTITSSILEIMTLLFTGTFILYLLGYVGIGLHELFTEKKENREFVDVRVNK